jgi:hypothetical protein
VRGAALCGGLFHGRGNRRNRFLPGGGDLTRPLPGRLRLGKSVFQKVYGDPSDRSEKESDDAEAEHSEKDFSS